jgi:hypothetical protein
MYDREITKVSVCIHASSITEVIKLEEHARWQGSGDLELRILSAAFPRARIETPRAKLHVVT